MTRNELQNQLSETWHQDQSADEAHDAIWGEPFDGETVRISDIATGETKSNLPPVLDVCCGPRGMWFNKRNPLAIYTDRRRETHHFDHPSGKRTDIIDPDIIADFTELPFPDNSFALVVMDPPHIQRGGADGRMTKRYGYMSGEWREMLQRGFTECFRVLKPEGTLIFKWCEVQFPIKDLLPLALPYAPLFGHRSGKQMKTHWVAFLKHNAEPIRSGGGVTPSADRMPESP